MSCGRGASGLLLPRRCPCRAATCWPALPPKHHLTPSPCSYLAFIYTMGATAPCSGDWPTPLRRWRLWSALAAYFPARLHATAELAPERGPFIFCCHPHGILAFTTVLCAGSLGTRFPGLDCRLLTLNINFMTPLFREYLLLQGGWVGGGAGEEGMRVQGCCPGLHAALVPRHACRPLPPTPFLPGMCDVSMSSLLCLLRRGKSIVIAVGGGTEVRQVFAGQAGAGQGDGAGAAYVLWSQFLFALACPPQPEPVRQAGGT